MKPGMRSVWLVGAGKGGVLVQIGASRVCKWPTAQAFRDRRADSRDAHMPRTTADECLAFAGSSSLVPRGAKTNQGGSDRSGCVGRSRVSPYPEEGR